MSEIPAYTHEACEALTIDGLAVMLDGIRALPDPQRREANEALLEAMIETACALLARFGFHGQPTAN